MTYFFRLRTGSDESGQTLSSKQLLENNGNVNYKSWGHIETVLVGITKCPRVLHTFLLNINLLKTLVIFKHFSNELFNFLEILKD